MTKRLEELEAEVSELRLQIDTLVRMLSESVPGVTAAQFKRELERARGLARARADRDDE